MKLTLLIPVLLLLMIGLFSFANPVAGQNPAHEVNPQQPACVFFVRHAETAADTKSNRDPELSEIGTARAVALADLLEHAGVTHLFASEYQRTQSTLKVLAERTEIEVVIVSAGQMHRQLADLQNLPAGSVAVVCGHSNTVPAMVFGMEGEIEDLKGKTVGKQVLEHSAHNRLFLVTLAANPGAAVKTLELNYGQR
ncbi:MAG: phosphoglycerate mutase family protein [Planctomycetota bacterium]|nr:phosphoglycerate mutase family protein [Planctomycetota bacterium]MDA1113576.1 phosphoglycerate mutase family protein [Planctomycetota bacterium]